MADRGLQFNATSFEDLGRKMREASLAVRAEMTPVMGEVGHIVAERAKQIAGQHGSVSIPPTIHTISGPGEVVIRAGGPAAPIANLWERGNRRSKLTAETFRHPVFGRTDGAWVVQEKHPFLRPALRENRPLVNRTIKKGWADALEPYGMKPSEI